MSGIDMIDFKPLVDDKSNDIVAHESTARFPT